VTSDATLYDEGSRARTSSRSRTVARHIAEVAIIIDSCHSG
jgi:hypothetical protein